MNSLNFVELEDEMLFTIIKKHTSLLQVINIVRLNLVVIWDAIACPYGDYAGRGDKITVIVTLSHGCEISIRSDSNGTNTNHDRLIDCEVRRTT